jgi:hypothetical protein
MQPRLVLLACGHWHSVVVGTDEEAIEFARDECDCEANSDEGPGELLVFDRGTGRDYQPLVSYRRVEIPPPEEAARALLEAIRADPALAPITYAERLGWTGQAVMTYMTYLEGIGAISRADLEPWEVADDALELLADQPG